MITREGQVSPMDENIFAAVIRCDEAKARLFFEKSDAWRSAARHAAALAATDLAWRRLAKRTGRIIVPADLEKAVVALDDRRIIRPEDDGAVDEHCSRLIRSLCSSLRGAVGPALEVIQPSFDVRAVPADLFWRISGSGEGSGHAFPGRQRVVDESGTISSTSREVTITDWLVIGRHRSRISGDSQTMQEGPLRHYGERLVRAELVSCDTSRRFPFAVSTIPSAVFFPPPNVFSNSAPGLRLQSKRRAAHFEYCAGGGNEKSHHWAVSISASGNARTRLTASSCPTTCKDLLDRASDQDLRADRARLHANRSRFQVLQAVARPDEALTLWGSIAAALNLDASI